MFKPTRLGCDMKNILQVPLAALKSFNPGSPNVCTSFI